jgi:hypothetical protein
MAWLTTTAQKSSSACHHDTTDTPLPENAARSNQYATMMPLVRRRLVAASHTTVVSPAHAETSRHQPRHQEAADTNLHRSHCHEHPTPEAPREQISLGPSDVQPHRHGAAEWHRTPTTRVAAVACCECHRKAQPGLQLREPSGWPPPRRRSPANRLLVEIGPEGWTPTQQPPEFSPSLRPFPLGYYFYLYEERKHES